MVPEFELKKGLLGGHTVSYQCPQCSTGLKARLDEAGKSDACPDCGAIYTIPGSDERNRIVEAEVSATRQKQEQAERNLREKESREATERSKQAAVVKRSLSELSFGAESNTPQARQLFEYRMLQIPPTISVQQSKGNEAAIYLQTTVNAQAREGWEFYRIDQFSIQQPAGCLLSFSGRDTITTTFHVVTFRRPTL
jgi:uncharacterized Zn finger protein (UPF0148 family)